MINKGLITWIASFPRSGNTWVRAFITAYANGGEVEVNSIMQTGDKGGEYYSGIIKAPIDQWDVNDQIMLKPAAMLRMLEDADDNLLLKTHDCNVEISGMALIPPLLTRAAIHVVRDPRDVALSFHNHYDLGSMSATIDQMLDSQTLTRFPDKGLFVPQFSWPLSVSSWLRELPYPVYTVRYEDLLDDPSRYFGEIVRFLKFDFDQTLLDKSIDSSHFERLQKQEKKQGFREGIGQQFFHQGQAGRWKKELDSASQKRIIDACQEQMHHLEYLT